LSDGCEDDLKIDMQVIMLQVKISTRTRFEHEVSGKKSWTIPVDVEILNYTKDILGFGK
jgi:hypothetical protein